MDIDVGQYFKKNQKKIDILTDADWKAALVRCKEYIRWKLKQKTCSGVHAAANLGSDPIDHYLYIAEEKLLSGDWEWKEEYSLAKQMIRIIDSHISTEVEKASTNKAQAIKIEYSDIEQKFYDFGEMQNDGVDETEYEEEIRMVEEAISGDDHLEFMYEAIKEGKKRAEIASLMEIPDRKLDKLREKLINKVQKYQSSQ